MNIEELKDRKAQLERDMEASLRLLLNGFHRDTGVSVASIRSDMKEVMFLSEAKTIWILNRVECRFDADEVAQSA